MIFFLFRTGAAPSSGTAGFRSMFAFWGGGGSFNPGGGGVTVIRNLPFFAPMGQLMNR